MTAFPMMVSIDAHTRIGDECRVLADIDIPQGAMNTGDDADDSREPPFLSLGSGTDH